MENPSNTNTEARPRIVIDPRDSVDDIGRALLAHPVGSGDVPRGFVSPEYTPVTRATITEPVYR